MDKDLKALLEGAQRQIPVGARYVHYKHREHTYVVRAVALIESTLLPAVVYEAEYGDKLLFIRPLSNFLEAVIVEGVSVPRFSLISEPSPSTE